MSDDAAGILLPHNRWDLLVTGRTAAVSVVVTHYEQPDQLRLVLAALAAQTHHPLELIVADDGSAEPPEVPDGVRVVRQEDRGFRAAAARNLGVAASHADVLVFLDADTVPDPDFVSVLVARVAVCPDVVAVGRRRHANLCGDGAELPEPEWLRAGYRATADLLHADGRSFRYVISAVMACRRELFEDLRGFDERYIGYGGEDWDFAYRAWNNGAVFVHEPAAVAWHDGPDWAGRGGSTEAKAAEEVRLAELIPEPSTRRGEVAHDLPDVMVDLPTFDARCVDALGGQDHRDLAIRIGVSGAGETHGLRTEPWSFAQLRRARVQVHLERPVLLEPSVVSRVVGLLVDEDLGEIVLRRDGQRVGSAFSTRALGRARRWGDKAHDVVGQCFGRRDFEVVGD